MESSLDRLLGRLAALAQTGSSTEEVLRAADSLVRRAVPAGHAVWATIDPSTMLFTSCLRFGLDGAADGEWLVIENELEGSDYNLVGRLSRSPEHAAALVLATGGRPALSPRFRALSALFPLSDELRIALVSQSLCWGSATLYRGAGERPFTPDDVSFAARGAAIMGEALRLSMLRALAARPHADDHGPGVVVVAADRSIESATDAARRLLLRLRPDGGVPPAVTAVAVGGRRLDPGEAHARVQDVEGRWIELHGSALDDGRAAVVLAEAQAPALAALIVQACGLTAREREVTELVLRGASTREIAEALVVTEYTVQDHLKSVFEKTGVRSRRALTAILNDRYYQPARANGSLPGPYGWFIPAAQRS